MKKFIDYVSKLFNPPRAFYCNKCGGVGWLFAFELDDYNSEDYEAEDKISCDQQVTCDNCNGTGFIEK